MRSLMHLVLVSASFAWFAGAGRGAPAQAAPAGPRGAASTDSPERQAAARALFEEGLALMRQERWADAVDRFDRAYTLRPTAEIAYNLSSALVRAGRLVRASELYRRVTQDPIAGPEVKQAAAARLEKLLPRLARLVIHLDGADPSEVTVELDGEPLESVALGVGLPVDPGGHVVSALRAGEPVAAESVTIAESDRVAVHLRLPEAPRSVTPAPLPFAAAPAEPAVGPGSVVRASALAEPPRDRSVFKTWWFWTLTAVAVGGAATAAVLMSDGGSGPDANVIDTVRIRE